MFSISITQIAAGIGGIAWLLRTHIAKNWQEQRWPLGVPFSLFALACLVAVVDAFDVSYSFEPLKKLLEILIFFWVVNCVRDKNLHGSLSTFLIISATLASLYGFYQGWRDGVNVMNRVEGSMSVYMTFAGLLMLVGVFVLARIIFKRPKENLFFLSLIIIVICLLFTLTRQAWFGFLMAFLFLGFVWGRKQTFALVFLLLGALLVYGSQVQSKILDVTSWTNESGELKDLSFKTSLDYRINRMVSGQDESFRMRHELWKVGWEIFKDHPLTGCGFRCVDLVHSQYPDPTGYVKKLRGMHNNFIQIAVDTGALGLSAWLGIWACFFVSLHRFSKNLSKNSPEKWVIFGSAAVGISFLFGGFFESSVYDSEVVMLLYFIMALPFTIFKINDLPKEKEV